MTRDDDVAVLMRDGASLSADVHRPSDHRHRVSVLIRSHTDCGVRRTLYYSLSEHSFDFSRQIWDKRLGRREPLLDSAA